MENGGTSQEQDKSAQLWFPIDARSSGDEYFKSLTRLYACFNPVLLKRYSTVMIWYYIPLVIPEKVLSKYMQLFLAGYI